MCAQRHTGHSDKGFITPSRNLQPKPWTFAPHPPTTFAQTCQSMRCFSSFAHKEACRKALKPKRSKQHIRPAQELR